MQETNPSAIAREQFNISAACGLHFDSNDYPMPLAENLLSVPAVSP